ncbi:MAG: glycosyltransferase family 8 protein [Oscillospiraceae bacterium]|jgi:lipopolysaccharide biosynthesis glycosyltransferase|nr:glycosyltransferase family 8 protein [Oscillospiraceae bacterium]
MMNLLVTLDANYVPPLTVLLTSLMHSNPMEVFTLYVAHSSLTENDFAKMAAVVDERRTSIVPVRVPEALLNDAPVLSRITKETYYRLLAIDYLPREVERVLYIDPDAVIINSLEKFYNIDFGDNLIAGSSHVIGFWEKLNQRRLHLPKNAKYINAGVMMMNLKGLRACGITTDDIFAFISANAKRLYLGDQDVINTLYACRILHIDPCLFNLDEKIFAYYSNEIDLSWVEEHTAVVHFNGKEKPWKADYEGQLGYLFERYNSGLVKIPESGKAGQRHGKALDAKRAG